MVSGAQFVMTFLASLMLMLCATNWDIWVPGQWSHVQRLVMVVEQFYLMMLNVWVMRVVLLTAQEEVQGITVAIIQMLESDAIPAHQVNVNFDHVLIT